MDDAATLSEAFACFDEKDQGVVDAAELRQWLGGVGDKMSDAEVRVSFAITAASAAV